MTLNMIDEPVSREAATGGVAPVAVASSSMSSDASSKRHAVHWRRLDQPAHEDAVLAPIADGWSLESTVAGTLPDGRAYALSYEVSCAPDWVTRDVSVVGQIGGVTVRVTLVRDPTTGRWTRDGAPAPAVDGCLDVDLGFSPGSNTLPIRRLDLAVGAEAVVRAAWLRFPELDLEPLEQIYRRMSNERYLYESDGGRFRAMLDVDRVGLVRRYGEYWIAADHRAEEHDGHAG